MDIFFGDTGGFRRHLGEYRVRALADLGGAHLQAHGAVLVEEHSAVGHFQRNRIHTRFIAEHRHAHATAHGAGFGRVFCAFLRPAEQFKPFLHTVPNAVGVGGDVGGGIHVPQRHGVFQPEGDGVQPKLQGKIIHQALGEKVSEGGAPTT